MHICSLCIKGGDEMDVDFGKLIRTCRKKAKLSQEAFADLMHTTQSTVSRIEKNLVTIEAQFLFRAARVTNSEDVLLSALFSIDTILQFTQMVPAFSLIGRFLFC